MGYLNPGSWGFKEREKNPSGNTVHNISITEGQNRSRLTCYCAITSESYHGDDTDLITRQHTASLSFPALPAPAPAPARRRHWRLAGIKVSDPAYRRILIRTSSQYQSVNKIAVAGSWDVSCPPSAYYQKAGRGAQEI